jgi:DNA-binding transcriptional ArsR family regulator
LVAIPTLRAAVVTGGLDVIFWNEPFDLSDTFALLPAAVLSSFAEGGPLYQYFKDVRNDLVAKLSALANPTRISILRMIRMHDLDNTQLASHLNISRPTASVHAKVLAEAGFIATYRDGRQAGHSFQPDSIVRLCDDLLRFLDVPEDDDGD